MVVVGIFLLDVRADVPCLPLLVLPRANPEDLTPEYCISRRALNGPKINFIMMI